MKIIQKEKIVSKINNTKRKLFNKKNKKIIDKIENKKLIQKLFIKLKMLKLQYKGIIILLII